MIAKTYILSSLKHFESRYNKASSQKEMQFISKFAILELCGWIEDSMDEIARRTAKRCMKLPRNRALIEKDVIKKNFGFDYNNHFRKMMSRIIGLGNIEKIENNMDFTKRTKLESSLASLKTIRDSAAHTHIKGMTPIVNTPSVILIYFEDVYNGLIEFDACLRSRKI